jgi:hypothetical protein
MNSEDQNLIVDTKYQQQILCQLIMANRYVGITNKFRIVNYGFFFSILWYIAEVLITHKVV